MTELRERALRDLRPTLAKTPKARDKKLMWSHPEVILKSS